MSDHDHKHDHHGHHHHHSGDLDSNKSFAIAFFSNLIFAIIEIIGGILTQSLAITADAVHDLGDAASIGIAWILEHYSKKQSDRAFNFGYRRFSLFAALISGLVIAAGAVAVAAHAIMRFSEPHEPAALGMIGLAVLGIAVNSGAALALGRGKTQNQKVLTWHLIEDILGWAAVLVGSIVIYITHWSWVDPAMAIGLSTFILWNVGKNLRDTIYLLLQGRPANFKEDSFRDTILKINGVAALDQVQVWSLDGAASVLSLRVHLHSVDDRQAIEMIKNEVRKIASQHGVSQVTIETCLLGKDCVV